MVIKDLDRKVRAVLAEDEKSRNSDIRLTQMIWWRYYRDYLMENNGKFYVDITMLYDLPRQDNVKRIRAKIQNEERMFLPTSEKVAKKRGWNEQEWRSYLNKLTPDYL